MGSESTVDTPSSYSVRRLSRGTLKYRVMSRIREVCFLILTGLGCYCDPIHHHPSDSSYPLSYNTSSSTEVDTMSSATTLVLKRGILAVAAVSPFAAYVAFDHHDTRQLSAQEVQSAKQFLARISPTTKQHHLTNIHGCGATVLTGCLRESDVALWKARTRATAKEPGAAVEQNGRLHCNIAKRSLYHAELAKIGGEHWRNGRRIRATTATSDDTSNINGSSSSEAPSPMLLAVVAAYFQFHGVARYKLTQLQLLNAQPGSTHQIWHQDNTAPGLTVLVALTDVRQNGPTELLLNSHKSSSSELVRDAWAFQSSSTPSKSDDEDCEETSTITHHQPVLLACLGQGDALLYDSRLLHRGRGYDAVAAAEVDRPVLILRWDATMTPPPGGGLITTSANKFLGHLLSAVICTSAKLKSMFE